MSNHKPDPMSSEDNEAWQPFQRVIEDKPHLALVRTDWTETGPDRSRGMCLIVTITYPPGEIGLPSPQTFVNVQQAEDVATAALERTCKADCLGTLMGDGNRHVYFYAASDAGASEAIAKLQVPEVRISLQTDRDPQWQRVVEDVWPTPEEMRWNGDKSVIDELAENGDDLTTPRPIEHLAVFPNKEAAMKFVQWLREAGFELMEDPSKNDGEWYVEFSQDAVPEIDEVYEQSSAATQAAEDLGGEYDGWQCSIVK